MAVVVVSQVERENGMTEVVLSEDGIRFRAMVDTDLVRRGDAYNMFQIMSNRQRAEHARLQAIRSTVGED